MGTKHPTPIPVDNSDIADVSEEAWDQDDRPDRFFEKIRDNEQAQARFEAALAEIHQHQATLAQVRKAKLLTQTAIANLLNMDQSEISRLEQRSDVLLSTLRKFIRAAGGELQLIATFPDATPVQLIVGEEPAEPQGAKAHR